MGEDRRGAAWSGLRALRLSARSFMVHPVRTALAIAGTSLGVAAVLILTAMGEGARRAVTARIDQLGRNMLVISTGKVESRGGRAVEGEGWYRSLRRADAAALGRLPGVRQVAPAQDRGMIAKFGAIQSPATVVGTTAEWRSIRQFPLAAGRFFTRAEGAERARVAVLGAAVNRSLFGDSGAVGRTIRIAGVPFLVVGALAAKGVSLDGTATEDDRIFVPLETALRRLFNTDVLKQIYLETASSDLLPAVEADAAALLRVRHNLAVNAPDDFAIQNQRTLLEAELATRASFRRLILGLGFLSLLVGGVGVLSLMQLSVRERKTEIGLRIAVGAVRSDIGGQFLSEALLMAGAGGAVGLLSGAAGAALLSGVTAWPAPISGRVLAVALVSVAAIGVAAGVVPALRAAALDPAEALRS